MGVGLSYLIGAFCFYHDSKQPRVFLPPLYPSQCILPALTWLVHILTWLVHMLTLLLHILTCLVHNYINLAAAYISLGGVYTNFAVAYCISSSG